MAGKRVSKSAGKPAPKRTKAALAAEVRDVLASLKKQAKKTFREDMASRYGIVVKKAWGVPIGAIQKVARGLGKDHELALALWDTGWYEARTAAAYVDDPALVTPAQMEKWCRDFDNWGIVDTVCFVLFDRTPHAYGKVAAWADRREEFERRASYVLMACLALHDKTAGDEAFRKFLPLAEKASGDGRNFVKKGVSWALRSIGRRSPALHADTVKLAQRLADSPEAAPRSLGKEVLRELTSPKVLRVMKSRRAGG
jgi:3-methyladenine DNA glycosylase AlkD